jgi:oligosaccharyltransferase complex subunit beta
MEWVPHRHRPWSAAGSYIDFVNLNQTSKPKPTPQGNFSARVRIPDVYGAFKWVLHYRRPGYSYLDLSEQVPVRPFRHDEYERFIPQAFPYYASALGMMAGFFALSLAFLYSAPPGK